MGIYIVEADWQYQSENFERGLIEADSIEEAEIKAKAVLNPLSLYVREIVFDEHGYCCIYSH